MCRWEEKYCHHKIFAVFLYKTQDVFTSIEWSLETVKYHCQQRDKGSFINDVTQIWPKMTPPPSPSVTLKKLLYYLQLYIQLHKSSYPLAYLLVVIYSRFSRSRQLGGRMPVFRLGVPPRYKASKLWYSLKIPPLIKERADPEKTKTLKYQKIKNTKFWMENTKYFFKMPNKKIPKIKNIKIS